MIIIAAEFDLEHPAAIDEAMRRATPLQQATRDDEPGCRDYVFSADPARAGRVQVYELWDDEPSLAAHFEHPNYSNMAASFGTIGLSGAVSRKFRVTAEEPVYDDSHVPRADFFTQDQQAPDQQIIIAGKIDFNDPDAVDEAVERSIPFQLATRNEEPGCEAYVFSKDPCVHGRLVVYELWDNYEALAPHFSHENYKNMGNLLRGYGISSDNRKYRCDVNAPVYDETSTPRRPRADFF